MKSNSYFKPFIILILILLQNLQVNSQINDYNYSVKNRWSIKASIANYKTAFFSQGIIEISDNFIDIQNRKMVNFKVETNYGINKFVEIGFYAGFQHYEWIKDLENFLSPTKSFAPLFGVSANFHILPFLVKSKNCRWDLYLTTKYGGCYLPHKEIDQPDFLYGKYRHEYGLGLGIGYYFKNIIGFFAEGSVGQYYYFKNHASIAYQSGNYLEFKDFSDSNFSFRIGMATKF